ncbi:ABC transporter ATP-binding protein [Homoserinibacter sp. GY 40078]|uniref:dipeptide ABC transporter ATP-binding protein n=1 Tax=Homoserinibacter sp. GY 40078 TaxID=2603275 RepID=UPI0011C9E459|nr:ABC transporter ATP-binding protein [Homoserinibacter sp. GY 40078]TXK17489.1 ABC transporter ATP-binding protein [Homoserinibacter sp. GY 40078]
MTQPLLTIDDLAIDFTVDGITARAVEAVSLEVAAGEVVALVGESGSGKTATAMAVLGLLPSNARVSGSVRLGEDELIGADEAVLREVRGKRAAMVFQDPQGALNPVFSIGFQVMESVRRQDPSLSRRELRARTIELLERVEIPEPEKRLGYYPHQLSGGQCQRVVIAMALASEPELLIADEPTTALDVTVQAEILDVLRGLRERLSCGILLITHDMGVVADLADRVVVMRNGRVVESGGAVAVFSRPEAPYTQELLASVPRIGGREATEVDHAKPAVLEVSDLVVDFHSRRRGVFRAVDGVTFSVQPSEILALVGESGSGKTTIGRSAIGLSPVTQGSVRVAGHDVVHAGRAERREMRRKVGVVFQNPAASLNPRYTVEQTVSEPLRVVLGLRGRELRERTVSVLESVGFSGDWLTRYGHQLSGGQRQRVSIARAVALDPVLLIADEPTSALDVSVQARVLDVFRELQASLGFACLFISHDLAVVDSLCDRVAVLRRGRLIEHGERSSVLSNPQQEYTRELVAAVPVPDPALQAEQRRRRLAELEASRGTAVA